MQLPSSKRCFDYFEINVKPQGDDIAIVPDLNLNPIDYPMEQEDQDQVVPNFDIVPDNQQHSGVESLVKTDAAGPTSAGAEILPD
ncbi:hypothetical protein M5689_013007 [Euphorbia peplus]|nr:hypothetical protein M5689_013007 [Euphorbia peplus]